MDIREIRELIELLDETGVAEIEIKKGEESVRIVSSRPTMASQPATTYAGALPAAVPAVSALAQPELNSEPLIPPGHSVKSPMVGTAFLSPSPTADPFVTVGQRVEVGDVLCIVEAMKMFNHIEADQSGVLLARLVENGQPVEYDQPLFIIDPS
jgi:acetyl-CoA carboxylase biotin carboxyl carrier protein